MKRGRICIGEGSVTMENIFYWNGYRIYLNVHNVKSKKGLYRLILEPITKFTPITDGRKEKVKK